MKCKKCCKTCNNFIFEHDYKIDKYCGLCDLKNKIVEVNSKCSEYICNDRFAEVEE